MRGNGTERKTGQAIKSEVLFRKEKQKTVSSTWAVEGERKKKKKERNKPQASPGFLHIQGAGAEGGDNGSQHTGDFKRHCLETRNEEKASMHHDYLRTGLAR